MSKITSVHSAPTPQSISSRQAQICATVAWLTAGTVSLIAVYVWLMTNDWQPSFNAYRLFPLLGLLAFSIMWSHYVAGFVRKSLHLPAAVLSNYYKNTSLVVLALLFLHPGILILQRFRDGYGFPPHSYESYVAPGLGWVTLLGTAAWLAFIAFEFRHFFSNRAWWKYVLMAGDAAMLAIVYHGLRLGTQLQMGWYRGLWLVYGLVLVVILGDKYVRLVGARLHRI